MLLLLAAVPLFNGANLAGWVQEGPRPSFFVAEKEIRTSGRGHAGNWLRSAGEYENFRLKFEYKLAQWAEAAIILRAPRTDRPQGGGITLMLAHDFHKETTPWVTGALAGWKAPLAPKPPGWGAWHKVEIELRGQHLKAAIDGLAVQDASLDEKPFLRRGYLGFPDMGHAYALRHIEIEDLGRPTRILELTNGRDLSDWHKRGDSGEWSYAEGVVAGANGHSILYAPGIFTDFEFSAAVRSHARTNSGVFLRGQPAGANRGFEVQIYSPVDAVYPTGSIYGMKRSRLTADLEGRWFLLQARVEGRRARVWVNGEPAAEVDSLPEQYLAPGRAGLQIHMEDTRVEFRDLRVRPLIP